MGGVKVAAKLDISFPKTIKGKQPSIEGERMPLLHPQIKQGEKSHEKSIFNYRRKQTREGGFTVRLANGRGGNRGFQGDKTRLRGRGTIFHQGLSQ